MIDHRYKKPGGAKRVADKNQFRLASCLQNVVDDGWYVVVSHFIPPVMIIRRT